MRIPNAIEIQRMSVEERRRRKPQTVQTLRWRQNKRVPHPSAIDSILRSLVARGARSNHRSPKTQTPTLASMIAVRLVGNTRRQRIGVGMKLAFAAIARGELAFAVRAHHAPYVQSVRRRDVSRSDASGAARITSTVGCLWSMFEPALRATRSRRGRINDRRSVYRQ